LLGFNADEANRITPEMGIPDHRSLGASHAGPAFQWTMVLVYGCPHHAANVEGFLPSGVSVVGENLAHSGEAVVSAANVRIRLHVPVDGIVRGGPPWEPLAWSHVGVLIMAQEDVAGLIDVSCPILRLAVETHDAVVSANPFVVLGLHAARV